MLDLFPDSASSQGGELSVGDAVAFQALTGYGPKPQMTMKEFADRTRTIAGQMFPAGGTVKKAVDTAWAAVGL